MHYDRRRSELCHRMLFTIHRSSRLRCTLMETNPDCLAMKRACSGMTDNASAPYPLGSDQRDPVLRVEAQLALHVGLRSMQPVSNPVSEPLRRLFC